MYLYLFFVVFILKVSFYLFVYPNKSMLTKYVHTTYHFPCAHTCRKCTTHINIVIHIQWCCCRQMTSFNIMMVRRGQCNLIRGDEDLWCLSSMRFTACICKMPSFKLVSTCPTSNLLYPSALSCPRFFLVITSCRPRLHVIFQGILQCTSWQCVETHWPFSHTIRDRPT